MTFPDLDRIAVTTGPGSFTGLRVGISAARGIALAADKPAVGLTTLVGLCRAAHRRGRQASRSSPRSTRGTSTSICRCSARAAARSTAPRLAPLAEAVHAAAAAPSRIVGSGGDMRRRRLADQRRAADAVDARAAPDIAWVARLGAVAAGRQSPPKPQYLRAPDAQPQDAARLPRR